MQHVKPGNLISIQKDGEFYYFLVLTNSAFFGCQWVYCFYQNSDNLMSEQMIMEEYGKGFPALVDFIDERRKNAILKLSTKIDVSKLQVRSNLKARIDKIGGGHSWHIYSPSFSIIAKQDVLEDNQLGFPIASGLKAADAIKLIRKKWKLVDVVTEEGAGQYPLKYTK